MDYKQKVIEFFKNDIYATETTGIVIDEVDVNYAKCHFDINRGHLNAGNVVMGGAIYTLADFTFAVAANAGNEVTVSQTCQITYHAPAKGKSLYAVAKCVKSGRSTCFFITDIFNDEDTHVATVTSTGFRKTK